MILLVNLLQLLNEIGASPVDIARAYMGHRMSETGDDGALVHLDGHSTKPFIGSSSHDSSIRWPGATVPNRYLTPQTQRSRYGLHDFRRTPYSRSIHSMSKSKVFEIEIQSLFSVPIIKFSYIFMP